MPASRLLGRIPIIESLMAIIVLGIILAVILAFRSPTLGYEDQRTLMTADLDRFATAVEAYADVHGSYPNSPGDLDGFAFSDRVEVHYYDGSPLTWLLTVRHARSGASCTGFGGIDSYVPPTLCSLQTPIYVP